MSPAQDLRICNTFEKEVMSWCIYTSVIRSILLQFVTVFAFSCLWSFNLWNPLSWISGNLCVILFPSSWCYDVAMAAGFVCLGVIYARGLKLTIWVQGSKLRGMVTNLLSTKVLMSFIGHACVCGMMMRCYLGLLGGQYSNLTRLCAHNGGDRCLNEPHVFLVLSGCHTGLGLWWDYHLRNGNVLQFPLVDESGRAQLRRKLGLIFREAVSQVLLGFRWFYVSYFLFGNRLENLLGDIFHMDLYGSDAGSAISTTFSRHISIFLHYLTLNALISFNVNLLKVVLNVNLTKRVQFPVVEGDANAVAAINITLTDAMNSKVELLRYLAFRDFADLTKNSVLRRSQFFMLSQPGGHPHNWNCISYTCLKVMENFSRDLSDTSRELKTKKDSISISLSEKFTPALESQSSSPNLRLRHNRPGLNSIEQDKVQDFPLIKSDSKAYVDNKSSTVDASVSTHKSILSKVTSYLTDKVALNSSPDAPLRSVYACSQPVIWASEGLSYLVASSISEDRYGVVQKDLSKVIIALLSLQQTLEQNKGLTATARKNRFETKDLQLKQELRVSLKSSLFRISIAFGNHLDSIVLPEEFKKRMSNYQTFMEC